MTRQPGALRRMSRASSTLIGFSNSMLTASEWPTKTGTRTQVVESLILGSRIFLVSAIIFTLPWCSRPHEDVDLRNDVEGDARGKLLIDQLLVGVDGLG